MSNIPTTARRKPSKQLLATTHEADEETYQKLAQACLRACMLREKDIWYRLPYFCKLAEDFPKGIIVAKDGLCDVYKAKTVKLCDWLHSKGFLPEGHRGIMLSMRELAYREAAVTKLLKNVVDSEDKNLYNSNLEMKEEEDGTA